MINVKVTGGECSQAEVDAYIARGLQKYGNGNLSGIDIHLDGEYVDLTYHTAPRPFNRLRRITGYLVGDMSRWNNAKKAEESQRVKHGVAGGATFEEPFPEVKLPEAPASL